MALIFSFVSHYEMMNLMLKFGNVYALFEYIDTFSIWLMVVRVLNWYNLSSKLTSESLDGHHTEVRYPKCIWFVKFSELNF